MRITCTVDNNVLHASPLWGEHGLSYVLETPDGKVLFDCGQSGTVLLHNLEVLGEAPSDFQAVVVSHAHYDHTGGLEAFLERAGELPLYAHPELFEDRLALRKKKPARSIGLPMKRKRLRKMAEMRLSADPQEILPNLWTTGQIREREEAEGRSDRHVICADGQLVPDPYHDDLSLVWKAEGGLVVVLGCAHAGVLNILAHVLERFGGPIQAIVGGTHLHDAGDAQIDHVARVLADHYAIPGLYTNHCTGLSGFLGLWKILGDRVKPCPTGTVLDF